MLNPRQNPMQKLLQTRLKASQCGEALCTHLTRQHKVALGSQPPPAQADPEW